MPKPKYNFFDQEDYAAFINDQVKAIDLEKHGSAKDVEGELRRGKLEQKLQEELNQDKRYI